MRNPRGVFTASLKRIIMLLPLMLLLVSGTALITPAQIGGLGGLIKGNPLSKLLDKTPITTSLDDAKFGDPSLDSSKLPDPQPITVLERTADGGFILKPGFYEMHAQSYCLHAGTHGPGGGDGYSYAPVQGPAKDAVISIVRNSFKHPEIQQRQIQQLLWAIIARAKFEDLSTELKAVALQLLTPKQLVTLNRSALDVISGPLLQRALGQMPPGVRQVVESEARLRQLLTTPGATFAEMERVAVLAGEAPVGEGSRQVPAGRWSRHPDGYYVRYLPRGYSYTVIQVWVPEERAARQGVRLVGPLSASFLPLGAGLTAADKVLDPSEHIAVPGNTSRQRLAQSPRSKCTPDRSKLCNTILQATMAINKMIEDGGLYRNSPAEWELAVIRDGRAAAAALEQLRNQFCADRAGQAEIVDKMKAEIIKIVNAPPLPVATRGDVVDVTRNLENIKSDLKRMELCY